MSAGSIRSSWLGDGLTCRANGESGAKFLHRANFVGLTNREVTELVHSGPIPHHKRAARTSRAALFWTQFRQTATAGAPQAAIRRDAIHLERHLGRHRSWSARWAAA